MLIFAAIGILFTAVFIGMQFGLFNVRGSIEARNNSILSVSTSTDVAAVVISATDNSKLPKNNTEPVDYSCNDTHTTCDWIGTREWKVVAGGLDKDIALIQRVSLETGVSPRLIAAVVVPEQIRFFSSNREVFKRYFEPLKILGSLSTFSLGVSGIKQETAVAIEQYANTPSSPLYPGIGYAELLAYPHGVNKNDELYKRLTNEKDHYYSYLYTAVFIKEILTQWELAGYDISNRPEIVATLFNVGFEKSNPHKSPKVGGARITVGGLDYTFGELAGLFYNSSELSAFLP